MALPAQGDETTFRPLSGGESPETQQRYKAGLEEKQLELWANTWFVGSSEKLRLNHARKKVDAQAKAMGCNPNEVLVPMASRPEAWFTPSQIDDYWEVWKPSFGTGGGGGTVGVQVPTVRQVEELERAERFAVVAVDDSGGDSGTRRPWTVIAVGDLRNGLVNQLSDNLKDLLSARLSKAYGLAADPPKKAGKNTAEFSFRGALVELMRPGGFYNDRILEDPDGLWVLNNLYVLMAVLDYRILDQKDALDPFRDLKAKIYSDAREGRIAPMDYGDYPILKASLGNLMVHAAFLMTGAIDSPTELNPDGVKQAEWLLERLLGIGKGHVVLASTKVTERYGVFARELPHSMPNEKGEVLIGRLRPWNETYDPYASKDDKEKRQVFKVQADSEAPGGFSFVYLDDNLQETKGPRWELTPEGIPSLDLELLREAANKNEMLVLQGTAIAKEAVYRVELKGDQIQVENLANQPWRSGAFPELAVHQRIKPRLEELSRQGSPQWVTMIRGEDEYSEADTWHGADALRHSVTDQKEAGSWLLYPGHEGEADANPEAIALIDSIPPGGIYVMGPGSDGTSILAVHDKEGMWAALERAVQRGVKVVMVMGISYDTDTHGRTYLEQLRDWQLAYRIGTGKEKALLGNVMTHLAINQLPPLERGDLAEQLETYAVSFKRLENEVLGQDGPVSQTLRKAIDALNTGTEIEVIQALGRIYRFAEYEAAKEEERKKLEERSDYQVYKDLGGQTGYSEYRSDPRRRALAGDLWNLVNQDPIKFRVYLLTNRLGGMAQSTKYRGPREPQPKELDAIPRELGVQVIYQPLVVVSQELRSDRGETKEETNARSDRDALARIYKGLLEVEAGLEELTLPQIHQRLEPLLDRLVSAPVIVLAMDVDGVTTAQDGDLSDETRAIYDGFIQGVSAGRILLLTDLHPGQLRDRVVSRLSLPTQARTIPFPLSGGAYVDHVIPDTAVDVIEGWVERMGGKETVLRMEDRRKEFAAGQSSQETLDHGFDINRAEEGKIVGMDIELNKAWLKARTEANHKVDPRDQWVDELQRDLRDRNVPESVVQTLHKSGSASITWTPPKAEALIRWTRTEGIDPARTIFVDDSASNFDFQNLEGWPGILLYIGKHDPKLPSKVFQIAQPGEGKPANGEEIARQVVQLVRAVNRPGGVPADLGFQAAAQSKSPVELLLEGTGLKAGMEEEPARKSITASDFVRSLTHEVRVLDFEQMKGMRTLGRPFVVTGTQTDAQGRSGLAYGMVLVRMGFPVGFIVDAVEEEKILRAFGDKSGWVAPWQVVRIDNESIFTPRQAISELQSRARRHRLGANLGEPVELGVQIPIYDPLVNWLREMGVQLPAEAVKTANWLITQAAEIFV